MSTLLSPQKIISLAFQNWLDPSLAHILECYIPRVALYIVKFTACYKSPKHGKRIRVRRQLSYIGIVARDVGVMKEILMMDRQGWPKLVMVPASVD